MKKILLLSAFLFFCQQAFAAIPFTFTNGTIADATEVNANFVNLDNRFSTTSGHDHDGIDSKSVLLGEWQGTVVDEQYGGTGNNVYASGDLIWATSNTVLARRAIGTLGSILIADVLKSEPNWLAPGTTGQKLFSAGSATNPVWGDNVAIGTFSRDTSLASGTQRISGLTFRPSLVIFIGCEDGSDEASWGFDDDTYHFSILTIGSGNFTIGGSQAIYDYETAGNVYVGTASFTNDGFIIDWTKTGTPTGTFTVYYLATR